MVAQEKGLAVVPAQDDPRPPAVPALPALTPKSLAELQTLGAMLAKSGLMPEGVRSPEAAAAIALKGIELGIPPMAAIEGISIIKGKPSCGAHLMLSLVKRAYGGGAIRVAETTDQRAVIQYREPGWPDVREYAFTVEMARTAGLSGDNWRKYPAAMLRARAISAVVKMAFPEVVGGMYVPDELGAPVVVTEAGEVEIDRGALGVPPAAPAAATAPHPWPDGRAAEPIEADFSEPTGARVAPPPPGHPAAVEEHGDEPAPAAPPPRPQKAINPGPVHGDVKRRFGDGVDAHAVAHRLAALWFGVGSLSELSPNQYYQMRKKLRDLGDEELLAADQAARDLGRSPGEAAQAAIPDTLDDPAYERVPEADREALAARYRH